MRRKLTAILTGSLLLLAACTNSDESTRTPTAEAAPSAPTRAPVSTGDPVQSDNAEAVAAYTEIDFEQCEVIESFEESGGSFRRCDGYQGTPLYVSQGDARMDLDAGLPDLTQLSPRGGAFNSIGETVEWRVRDSEPFAVIVRFDIDTGVGDQFSDLAVLKVGRVRSPGCLVAWVPAEAEPDQNTAARQIADSQAADFSCAIEPDGPELPTDLLGRFAPNADECAERVSVNEVIVTQNRLEFFYGYADLTSTVSTPDGFRLDTALYQLEGAVEIVPESVSYLIRPDAGVDRAGGIVFEFVGASEPQLLVRCDE